MLTKETLVITIDKVTTGVIQTLPPQEEALQVVDQELLLGEAALPV